MTDLIKAIEHWQKSGTEGPWEICDPIDKTQGWRSGIDAVATGEAVVWGTGISDEGIPLRSNAVLMAAAPDMAKIVLAAVELADVVQSVHPGRMPYQARDAARTFRKAMGGE